MSKKVLVFDNQEEIDIIVRGALSGTFTPKEMFDDLVSQLKDHELKNVTEFEAEVEASNSWDVCYRGKIGKRVRLDLLTSDDVEFKEEQKLLILVAKKEGQDATD